MEMIFNFYWPNILAAIFLIFIFCHLGQHLIARNKAMEVMLLGQEFQTGILTSALLLSLFESGHHDDHGLHIEFFVTGLIVLFIHSLYLFIHKRFRHIKVEGAVSFIVLLILTSQFIVSLNPGIEFHMVKSMMGDIVTVSKGESVFVSLLSLVACGIYYSFRDGIHEDTMDISLFNKRTHKGFYNFIFNILVFTLMFMSIHLLGSIFTLGALFIPAFVLQFFYVTPKTKFILFIILSLTSPLSFFLLTMNDRLAPTLLIILLITVISVVYGFIFKK